MSHPSFENIGEIEDRVQEECAELIMAVSKAKRFGWFGFNPYDPKKETNTDAILREMNDVLVICGKLRTELEYKKKEYEAWKREELDILEDQELEGGDR